MLRWIPWLRTRAAILLAECMAVALLAACGGGGGTTTPATSGTLRVAMTDAPACGFDAVYVTVEKIRVHQSADADANAAGWSEIRLDPARRVNLLSLSNGVLLELGQTALPPGRYTQMRLVLAANGGAAPLANAVVLAGSGTELALTTPSGQQAGLKMKIGIEVEAGQMADLVIDFDACKSVVTAGMSGRYLLKPVLKAVPRLVSGVQGHVDVALANGDTAVSLQQDGVIVKATVPETSGRFMLAPVAAGTYDLVVTAPGHATAVVTGVTVTADAVTAVNTSATALALPASANGTATGKVTTGAPPIDAYVRAEQPLTGGRRIVVADTSADADSGHYTLTLSVGAPRVASFVALPNQLVFAADAAAAGKYALVATSAGASKPTTVFTLAAGATVTTDFTFP